MGYFGIPDTISDKNLGDSTQVSHTVYRPMKPIEDFLRNCPHISNPQSVQSSFATDAFNFRPTFGDRYLG